MVRAECFKIIEALHEVTIRNENSGLYILNFTLSSDLVETRNTFYFLHKQSLKIMMLAVKSVSMSARDTDGSSFTERTSRLRTRRSLDKRKRQLLTMS